MLGQRVKALRKDHGLQQETLAGMVGTSPSQISLIENNKSQPSLKTAAAIARALDTSLDFLTGTIDDKRRSTMLLKEIERQARRTFEVEAGIKERGFGHTLGSRGIQVNDRTVGTGGIRRTADVTAMIGFPRTWLNREGLEPHRCEIIGVAGESMEPTLPDECSILVDRARRNLEDGKVFVISTGDGLIAGRAVQQKSGNWLLESDNPDKKKWPTMAWPADARIVGEVRWVWHSLP